MPQAKTATARSCSGPCAGVAPPAARQGGWFPEQARALCMCWGRRPHSQQPVRSRHHSQLTTASGGTCANRGEVRSHRGSRRRPRGTLEGARRAVHRGRPARLRPTTPRRCGSCAAALVTTTTVACQVVGSRARCHRVQMATIAERGANAGTARRARDGGRAHPAIRHRVCIRARSCVRRLTILVPIGAGFGHGTRTHTLSRTLTRREASKCAVRPQSAARGRSLAQITCAQITTAGSPKKCRFSFKGASDREGGHR